MFNSQFSLPNFLNQYQKNLSAIHQTTKIAQEEKYSQLLKVLASAGNDFDAADKSELANKVSQILEILTAQIKSASEITNQKISSKLSIFKIQEDIIEID